MSTDPTNVSADNTENVQVAGSGSASVSLSGAQPLGASRAAMQRPDSATVSITSVAKLSRLPALVSALVQVGESATVRLQSGSKETLRSAIATLNERTVVKSAVLSIAGRGPVK